MGGLWRWADLGGGRTLGVGGLWGWGGLGKRWRGWARRGSGWGEQASRRLGGSKGVTPCPGSGVWGEEGGGGDLSVEGRE